MSDYDLYCWSVLFRGQFVQAVVTCAGKTWTESDDGATMTMGKGGHQLHDH